MILTAVVFFVILSLLVLIHELGHFLVAKKLNIKVEEFGFGLPPRLWGFKKGETIYSINWLPIGGFVKLFGEDEAGKGDVSGIKNQVSRIKKDKKIQNTKHNIYGTSLKRAFFARSVRQRAAVVAAGVVMNTLLAIILFYAFMLLAGFRTEIPLLSNYTFFGVTETVKTQVTIDAIEKKSPAAVAKIPVGARLTAINDQHINEVEAFTKIIKKQAGTAVKLSYIDPVTAKTITTKITPRVNPPKGQGALGVSLFGFRTAVLEYKTPIQKLFSGVIHPANLLLYNFDVIGVLVKSAIKEHDASALSQGVSGPVGIYSIVGTIVQIPDVKERLLELLNLAGILSISLAFFNILPIPALDGGRLFFILVEGVLGKKVDPKYEALAHTIGMAVLLLLILLVTFKDIFQFIL